MTKGKTLQNGAIGAVVTTVMYFVPVVQAIAPLFGGSVAGYLQKQGMGGGMKAGGVKGIMMVIPAIAIGIIGGGMLAQIPVIGGIMTGSLAILVVIIVLHSVAIGVAGGLLGGIVAE